MPKIVDHAMLSSLRQWALSVDGSFPQRFRLILEHAFAEYAVVLSPSQLRDVGRGGTQQTAQAAIDEWLKRMHSAMGLRLSVGAEVPVELVQRFERIVPDLWAQCRALAAQDFDVRRLELESALAMAMSRESSLQAELASVMERSTQLSVQMLRAQEQLAAALQAKDSLELTLGQANAALTRQREQLSQQAQQHEQDRGHFAQQLAQARKEFDERWSEAQNAHIREINNLQHQSAAMMDALQKEKREALAARDQAVGVAASADIAAAKAQREADLERQAGAQAQQRAKALQEQLDHAQAKLQELISAQAIERAHQSAMMQGKMSFIRQQIDQQIRALEEMDSWAAKAGAASKAGESWDQAGAEAFVERSVPAMRHLLQQLGVAISSELPQATAPQSAPQAGTAVKS